MRGVLKGKKIRHFNPFIIVMISKMGNSNEIKERNFCKKCCNKVRVTGLKISN